MPDGDRLYSRADLDSLIGINEIRVLYSRGRRRLVAKSYADRISRWPGFPKPLIVHPKDSPRGYPQLRLWWPADVEEWMRRTIPRWDDLPPASES